jgi:hypothetical protein
MPVGASIGGTCGLAGACTRVLRATAGGGATALEPPALRNRDARVREHVIRHERYDDEHGNANQVNEDRKTRACRSASGLLLKEASPAWPENIGHHGWTRVPVPFVAGLSGSRPRA